MKEGVIVNRTGSQIVTALSFIFMSTLFCAGIDHNPSWNNNILSYSLPVSGYIDEFDPGDYGMCRFGNWLDDCVADYTTAMSLYFNHLTTGRFTNSDMDNPHGAGLFLWHLVDGQASRRTFTSASAGWATSSENSGRVTFSALRGITELYRYFTFKDEQLPGLDSSTKKYVILIHGWNPDSNTEAYGNEPDGGQFYRLYNNVNTWIGNNGASSWRVLKYHMERDTDTGPVSISAAINGTEAAEIARLHGYHMAKLILQKW
jgi:hypothetical protein